MVAFIKLVGGPSGDVANEFFHFNGDSASNYSRVRLLSYNSAISSSFVNNSDSALQTFTPCAGVPGLSVFDIMSYSGSTFKTVIWSDSANNTNGAVVRSAVSIKMK